MSLAVWDLPARSPSVVSLVLVLAILLISWLLCWCTNFTHIGLALLVIFLSLHFEI